MTAHLVPSHDGITLGIFAGGKATRLDGRDKAWLERAGVAQVVSLAERFAHDVDAVLVSANRNAERYLSHGLRAIHDRLTDLGPIGGLEALAFECRTEWLLTLPVDMLVVPDDLVATLSAAGPDGARAEDDDGVQPLVALWRVDTLRAAIVEAIAGEDFAVHALQARLALPSVAFAGVRFGNLNTPDDLVAAGIDA